MTDLRALPHLIQTRDWPRAEALLRAAADQPNAPAEVFYNLAKVLEARGKWTDAGPWLDRAVAARDGYANAWFELGRWAVDTGEYPKAFGAFQRAVALDPDDSDARRNLGRVALRLGEWDVAQTAFTGETDVEAQIALYRAATERGEDARSQLADLLARTDARPAVFKAMTRTAKGRVPLRLPR